MIEFLIYLFSFIVCIFFGYKMNEIVRDNREINKEIEKLKKNNYLDNLSNDDINRLYDKYE